jgi:predicted transposase YbfD/YdcC
VTARETRYFACSLDPRAVTPRELLALVRGHWGVENRLHFIKDRWWDEDRHYLSRPGLAERFAVLTGAALAVLRLTRDDPGQPLRARADELCGDVQQAISLLTENNL